VYEGGPFPLLTLRPASLICVGGALFAHLQSRTSGHTALLFFPFVFQLLWRIVFAGGGRQCWLWGRGACLYIFRRLLLASVFCCQHQKYFPSRKKIKEEKNWVAGRKKLLIGNRSVRPRVLQLSWAILQHLPAPCVVSLRVPSFFCLSVLAVLYLHLIVALKIHRNTSCYDSSWPYPYLWPQSVSVGSLSHFWSWLLLSGLFLPAHH